MHLIANAPVCSCRWRPQRQDQQQAGKQCAKSAPLCRHGWEQFWPLPFELPLASKVSDGLGWSQSCSNNLAT